MSWFFKSFPFQSEDPDSSPPPVLHGDDLVGSPSNRGGVKEDLTVIGETISRQLRGVAAFLAPPPPPLSPSADQLPDSSRPALFGIRDDLAEIGGSFKSGLSLLSSNKAVAEISKFASNLLQDLEGRDDDDVDDVAGITEKVIEFVKEISMKPECWDDFPLPLNGSDFIMSHAQKEHTTAVEKLVPNFAALRENIHTRIGEEQFWLIYFTYLLPILDDPDLELLSSPKIVETRNLLHQNLRRNTKTEEDGAQISENLTSQEEIKDEETSKVIHIQEKEIEIKNGTEIIEIANPSTNKHLLEKALEKADTEAETATVYIVHKNVEYEDEDVSFSDLEDDENDLPTRPGGSRAGFELNENSKVAGLQSTSREKDSEDETNDWLAVDDDFD